MAGRELNIAGLLKRGAMQRGDEPVSALDHALQCAARARAARARDEVVRGGLALVWVVKLVTNPLTDIAAYSPRYLRRS